MLAEVESSLHWPRDRLIPLAVTAGMVCSAGLGMPFAWRAPAEFPANEPMAGITGVAAPAADLAVERPPLPALQPLMERGSAEILVEVGPGESLATLLERVGAQRSDIESIVAAAAARFSTQESLGTQVAIVLGDPAGDGKWTIRRVSLRPDVGPAVRISSNGAGDFRADSEHGAAERQPVRVRGKADGALYWSLRAAGVPADVAVTYSDLLSRAAGRQLTRPGDEFDLVMQRGPGRSAKWNLLYASLDRVSGRDVRLVKWTSGWIDPFDQGWTPGALARPVAGRVTSPFGHRIHPILRFGRFHSGVDFGAEWGTPVTAAADGQIVAAGWNGGYGRQVRIAHPAGLESSYAHLSRISAHPGSRIRRGEIIGYVGSTGFSTGSHLHFEVSLNGRKIDPLSFRLPAAQGLPPSERIAVKRRLDRLMAIAPTGAGGDARSTSLIPPECPAGCGERQGTA